MKARGFTPILAVAEDQVAKTRASGLDAVAILPGFATIRERMGLDVGEAVRRLMSDQRQMLEHILLPSLSSCAHALDRAAADAEAVIATPFVFAAPIIAEKRGIPLISAVLQPMAMLSAYDPPSTPDFWMAKHPPVGAIGVAWNRALYTTMRMFLRRHYSRQLDAVRAEHGLPPRGAAMLLEPGGESALVLGCYSELLGSLQPDAPAHSRIVGFPFFDSHSGRPEVLSPALSEFLEDGPPPIVFTLGTFAVLGPGDFYAKAAEVARALGRRAVLLTGEAAAPRADGDIFRCGYVPHSLLFPRAAVIVHHGGVGTTGQALRAGKPQLIVPHMGDQHDHAHRIERLGVGLSLKARQFATRRAVPRINRLFDQSSYREQACRVGRIVSQERGSDSAAAAIAGLLSTPPLTDDGLICD